MNLVNLESNKRSDSMYLSESYMTKCDQKMDYIDVNCCFSVVFRLSLLDSGIRQRPSNRMSSK